ncbi:PIN domain-containing protein [Candidatus Pacearchaeota archaeon]|nr:PIN domain-containing protein [Candidatus Pacearchaeota archaeon]
MSKFLFDTYAIIETLNGNEDYSKYLDSEIVINNFIFAELCYNLLKNKEKETEKHLDHYSKQIISVKPEWIKGAMRFRIEWKDRNVSITDCIGYIMAKELNIKFLTGDKEFKGLDNVEFVK